MAHLGLRVFDPLDSQVEFILVIFRLAFVLGTSIRQDSKQGYLMIFKEWQDPVIKDVGGGNCMFGLIEFGEGYPAIGVDKSLLVDPADALDIADIIGILRTQVSRMLGLNLSKGLAALFLPFHGHQL